MKLIVFIILLSELCFTSAAQKRKGYMYCKYAVPALKSLTPILPEDNYKMTVMVVGEIGIGKKNQEAEVIFSRLIKLFLMNKYFGDSKYQ